MYVDCSLKNTQKKQTPNFNDNVYAYVITDISDVFFTNLRAARERKSVATMVVGNPSTAVTSETRKTRRSAPIFTGFGYHRIAVRAAHCRPPFRRKLFRYTRVCFCSK